MKALNVENMTLVHRGEDWPFAQNPCTKEMMSVLEKNERYISWLQPNNKKTEDQIPALRIEGKYYLLSLRMMKCIWRHVRLHKGFVNLETGVYGSKKLKIPMLLYIEKIRTQRRFNLMRMEQASQKEQKNSQNASSKVTSVVNKVLLPLLHAPVGGNISFQPKDMDEVNRQYLEHLTETEPEALSNRDAFIQKMTAIYDNSNIKHN